MKIRRFQEPVRLAEGFALRVTEFQLSAYPVRVINICSIMCAIIPVQRATGTMTRTINVLNAMSLV